MTRHNTRSLSRPRLGHDTPTKKNKKKEKTPARAKVKQTNKQKKGNQSPQDILPVPTTKRQERAPKKPDKHKPATAEASPCPAAPKPFYRLAPITQKRRGKFPAPSRFPDPKGTWGFQAGLSLAHGGVVWRGGRTRAFRRIHRSAVKARWLR